MNAKTIDISVDFSNFFCLMFCVQWILPNLMDDDTNLSDVTIVINSGHTCSPWLTVRCVVVAVSERQQVNWLWLRTLIVEIFGSIKSSLTNSTQLVVRRQVSHGMLSCDILSTRRKINCTFITADIDQIVAHKHELSFRWTFAHENLE